MLNIPDFIVKSVLAALEYKGPLRRATNQNVIQPVCRCARHQIQLVLPHGRALLIPDCRQRHTHVQLQNQSSRLPYTDLTAHVHCDSPMPRPRQYQSAMSCCTVSSFESHLLQGQERLVLQPAAWQQRGREHQRVDINAACGHSNAESASDCICAVVWQFCFAPVACFTP